MVADSTSRPVLRLVRRTPRPTEPLPGPLWRSPVAWAVALGVLAFSFWQAQPYVPTKVRAFFGGGDISYLYWLFAWQLDRLGALDLHGLVNAPIFSPEPYGAAFSGQVLSSALAALPLALAGADARWLYNLMVFATYPLSFLGAYLFTGLGGWRPAARLTAAALFAFSSYRLNTGGYLSHMAVQWIPFVLYFLTRYIQTSRAGQAWACCLFFLLHAGASEHNFVLGNLYLPLYAGLILAASRRAGRPLPGLRPALAPLGLALLGSAALYWPSLQVARMHAVGRSLADTLLYAADLEQFLGAKYTWLFSSLLEPFAQAGNILWPTLAGILLFGLGLVRLLGRRAQAGPRLATALTALGLVAACAAGLAVKAWPDLDLFAAWYFVSAKTQGPLHAGLCLAAGAVLAWLLVRGFVWAASATDERLFAAVAAYMALVSALACLGPLVTVHGVQVAVNPAAYVVYALVPGGDAVRAVTRSFHFFSLFFAVVCAFAFDSLATGPTRLARLIALQLAVLLVLDLVPVWAPDVSLTRETETVPPHYAWLRAQPEPGPVLELPLGEDSDCMERSLVHRKPLINGFGSFAWRGYAGLRQALERRGLAGSLGEIEALGTRYLVVRDAGENAPASLGPFTLKARFGPVACYENPSAGLRPLPADLARALRAHLYGLDGDRLAVVLDFSGLQGPRVSAAPTPLELTLTFDTGEKRTVRLTLPPGLWGPFSQWDSASDARLRLTRPDGRYPLRVEMNGQTLFERRPGDPEPRVAGFDAMMTDLSRINLALLAHYRKYGTYPRGGVGDVTEPNGAFNPRWIDALAPEFLPELPRDPRGLNDPYRGYLYLSDSMTFKLIAHRAPDGYRIRYRYPQVADPVRGDAYGVFLPDAAAW